MIYLDIFLWVKSWLMKISLKKNIKWKSRTKTYESWSFQRFQSQVRYVCLLLLKDPSAKYYMPQNHHSMNDTGAEDKHMWCIITKGNKASALCLGETWEIFLFQICSFLQRHFYEILGEQHFCQTSKMLFYADDIIIYLCQAPQYDNGLW